MRAAAAVRTASTRLCRSRSMTVIASRSCEVASSFAVAARSIGSAHKHQQTRTRCFKHLITPASQGKNTNCSGQTTTNASSHNILQHQQQRRGFQNEASFHEVADETLETIQDAIEEVFEDRSNLSDSEMPEVNVASGVLTLSMPPHGTWVLNKQTPNRQIWWSSPLSGPRRYEYDDDEEVWLYTRYVDARKDAVDNGTDMDEAEFDHSKTLGLALSSEIQHLYDLDIELDV